MTEFLFIRLGNLPESCEWIAVDGDGRQVDRPTSGPLREAARSADGRRVIVLVPGPEVITTQVTLPTTSQARMRQMLPFTLEDSFAEDIEELAFAIGPKISTGAYSVSVVARRKLEEWLSWCSAAGIEPVAIYSEADGVPDTPSTMSIVVEHGLFLGRRPDKPPLVLQGLGLTEAFAIFSATPETEHPVQHAIIYIDAAGQQALNDEFTVIEGSLASLNVRLLDGSALPGFAAKLVHEPGTNLLQGRYSRKSDWAGALRPWRLAAGLLIGYAAASMLAATADYVGLRRQDAALSDAVADACTEVFGASRISQCEAEVRDQLRALGDTPTGGGAGFLSTLAAVAEYSGPAETLEQMSYRDGVLDLQLIVQDIPTLDSLSQNLNSTGRFNATIQSTNPDGNGVEGRIQVLEVAQ